MSLPQWPLLRWLCRMSEFCMHLSGNYPWYTDSRSNIFIKDYSSDTKYQQCLSNVKNNHWDCIVECDNLDGTDETDCERQCLSVMKIEHGNCPCQVCHIPYVQDSIQIKR